MPDQSKKEIIVFPAFYPPHIGGMEFFAHELNQRLAQSGWKVTICAPNFLGEQLKELTGSGGNLTIIYYPAFEIILNFPCPKFWRKDFWDAIRNISHHQSAIVISHTRFFIASSVALVFSRIKDLPLLHIEHGSSPVQSKNTFISVISELYDTTLGRLVIRKAKKIIAISQDVSDFVQKQWAVKSEIIRRGFDPSAIAVIPDSQEFPRSTGITRLMYIGRLISGKGLDTLLDGLMLMQEKNWELIVIGDGPARQSLEKLAKQFTSNQVMFLGKKNPQETIALLKTTDIFINPSRSEGLPTTVAEAALCRKAIVATNVGGTRELFPEANQFFLVPADNPAAIADRISKFISNPALIVTTGNTAQEFIVANFSWDRTIERFTKVLNEIVR